MVMKTSGTTGARRRVFSDTETMMYDTSSDENDSTFDPPNSKLIGISFLINNSGEFSSIEPIQSAISQLSQLENEPLQTRIGLYFNACDVFYNISWFLNMFSANIFAFLFLQWETLKGAEFAYMANDL